MCEALRELMKDEIEEEKKKAVEKAVEKAARETEQNTVLASIKSLMENTKWTADRAMAALNVPVSERSNYAAKL